MLRNGRCQRGNNSACFLKHAQLERYGSADNFILPLKWNGEASRPFRPVLARTFFPITGNDSQENPSGIHQPPE